MNDQAQSEFDIRIYVEITRFSPSPLAGEGGGEGHTLSTPTSILPHQGGG